MKRKNTKMDNIETNLAQTSIKEEIKSFLSKLIKRTIKVLVISLPWLYALEIFFPEKFVARDAVFVVVGVLAVLFFFRILKREEIEWKNTKIEFILAAWVIAMGLILVYSSNYLTAWKSEVLSFSGGISEYIAFIFFYYIAVQFFEFQEYKKLLKYFAISLLSVVVILLTASNFLNIELVLSSFILPVAVSSILLINFFRTSNKYSFIYLILSVLGVVLLILLNSYLGLFMFLIGLGIVVLFDLLPKIIQFSSWEKQKVISMSGMDSIKATSIFSGATKYLMIYFVIVFALFSSFYSKGLVIGRELKFLENKNILDIFTSGRIFVGFGESSYNVNYFLGLLEEQGIFGLGIYLVLIFFFILYLFQYFKKKEKNFEAIVISLSLISAILVSQIFVNGGILLRFLTWMVIILGGITFLRSLAARDYLRVVRAKSFGRYILIAIGVILSAVILGFVAFRIFGFLNF